ncbi:glycosyltransferase family 2 protein [Oleiharenicola lentus]|uniref:glycosyltransferase family 2 protein n=1 Tax=Oleiharenicola lentus TaxID=2508720 RepID=UPI003F666F26
MNPSKISVSVLIPIRNESANLARCLASVAWADEIFVVDSHSSDDSVAIATAAGAKVVQFDFNGIWPKKKNWALENLPFSHEWVLILDADEVMPPSSAGEIGTIVELDGAGHTGFWINRRFMFMGGWLRHAYYPNWNLRLFRHRVGRYEQLVRGATHSGDNEVHEHIFVEGLTGKLSCQMDHYAFPSIDVFMEKHNRYSNWEARLDMELESADRNPSADRPLQSTAASLRRRLKLWSRRLPFRPTLRFLYVYLVQRGFLDGARGFYFARLHAVYEFMSVAKAAELRLPAPRSVAGVPLVRSVGA